MSQKKKIVSRYRKVLKLMELQRRSLSGAASDKDILDAYSAILDHLAQFSQDDILHLLPRLPKDKKAKTRRSSVGPRGKPLSRSEIERLAKLSLEEVEEIAYDESTPRKVLEAIAVGRFQVPQGSLRSYSSVDVLREKILTRARNEQGHHTISSVAQQIKG